MNTVIVIPARYASTRYPGKPLVKITGASGRSVTLLQRSWEVAKTVEDARRVVIATDDIRIKNHAEDFGAEVIMTSENCKNCLLYTSPSPRDMRRSRMPSSA